ncbi:MAG: hypothetical protein EOO15_10225 [Chitinophagaceae bacterium]|nr:MAG: hypothetical protein EOO15_10225 [Chitinophagaceae bacterium]
MQRLLTLILTCITAFAFGQTKGVIYIGISSDTAHVSHFLTFLTDSTVEISSIPRHMSPSFKKVLTYTKESGDLLVRRDSARETFSGFPEFSKDFYLTAKGRALLDTFNKTVYVQERDFKTYDLLYIIDGKRYKQKVGQVDAYGLVKKSFPENVDLKKLLSEIKPTVDTYKVKFYKGVAAYSKYGYRFVYGVVELSRKQ